MRATSSFQAIGVLSEKLIFSAFNKIKMENRMSKRVLKLSLFILVLSFAPSALAVSDGAKGETSALQPAGQTGQVDYKLLATNKTSTMQKEMNEAADAGFKFGGVMGGETAFGGSEAVVIMTRDSKQQNNSRYKYKLLATNKTSTMQKELQEAGNEGFEYKGQTVYSSTFGGKEVVVILERDSEAKIDSWEYKLLATSKTSTMQKELSEAGAQGYEFVGVTVSETSFGGKEVVSILRRPVRK